MVRYRHEMCVIAVAALAACVHPHPITDIGPEHSLNPLDVSVQKDGKGIVQVDLTTGQAAYITVFAVERNDSATLLVQSPESASVWLTPGTHHLTLRPIPRPIPKPARPDPVPDLLSSMGLTRGTFQPLVEPCFVARPTDPQLCPVPSTEPLVPAQRVPPARYLLFVATDKPLDLDKVQERLRALDLSADGRELLTEVAYAAGLGPRW